MKVVFLGAGEAFDESLHNNSSLILSETKLLLDCGYSVPQQVWKYDSDPDLLDAIYVSHFHADHYFGLPQLMMRMWEDKRTKPLKIICQKGGKETIEEVMGKAYPGFRSKYKYEIKFMEVAAGDKIKVNELELSFALTTHSQSNLAVRITNGKSVVCYSGDGDFTDDCVALYKGCGLLVHETYMPQMKVAGHGCVKDVIAMAENNDVKCLALTHIQRDVRKKHMQEIKDLISESEMKVIVPEPGDEMGL